MYELGPLMAKITGYDGGDGEEQLIAALKEDFASEVTDAWEKIRTRYMYTGSIVEIAVARGYTTRLGFKGWCVVKLGKGETHARDCLKCWERRRDFDRVREWVEKGNHGFQPAKLSGPLLYLESHKAWSNRLTPDGAKKKTKKLSAKELRQLAEAYRAMLDRVGGEHVKQAEINHFEPRVWNAIVQERAALEAELGEGEGDPDYPINKTPPTPQQKDADVSNGVKSDEQDAVEDADEASVPHPVQMAEAVSIEQHPSTVPLAEQYPGTPPPNFVVVGPVVPPQRTPPPAQNNPRTRTARR